MQWGLDEVERSASQGLHLKPRGMAYHGYAGERHFTLEGGAEYDWSLLIEALQR